MKFAVRDWTYRTPKQTPTLPYTHTTTPRQTNQQDITPTTDMKFAVRDWTYRAIDAYAHRASGGGGIAIAPLEDEQQKEVG